MNPERNNFILVLLLVSWSLALSIKYQAQTDSQSTKAPKNTTDIFKAKNGDCYASRKITDEGIFACLDRKNYALKNFSVHVSNIHLFGMDNIV